MSHVLREPEARSGAAETVLRVEELTVRFPTPRGLLRAVNSVSFDLKAGETLAIVGESGCGKTATALSLMRLLPEPPAQVGGRVWYGDRDILSLTDPELREIRGGQIAMVFQDPQSSLNPVLKVGTQMVETLQLHLRLG